MTRFRIGAALLALLLAISLLAQWGMARIHLPIARTLEETAQYARAENWASAVRSLSGAEARWLHYRGISAALADHQPMEDIEALFAQLKCLTGEPDFAPLCMELRCRVTAMADAHRLTWWNLL